VLVASNVPNKVELLAGMKGTIYEYDYNSQVGDLIGLVHALTEQNEGPFGSIAILCHNGGALLRLCATMNILNEKDIAETDIFQAVLAIAGYVKPKGRMDFPACRLDSTRGGKELLSKLSKSAGKQFSARDEKRPTGGSASSSTPRGFVADTLADIRGAQAHKQVASTSPAGKRTPVVEAPTF
jgi:hypothetical protein